MEAISHHQPAAKQIMKDATEMQDPSLRFNSIVEQCTKPTDRVKLATKKGESALATSYDLLTRLKDDGCDLIKSVELSSAVRTTRQLSKRTATETECAALSEANTKYVEKIDGPLKTTWTEAFKNTTPHQLTADIQEIQGMCEDILDNQQQLINRLRDEVNVAEQSVQLEIERETEDLSVMRRRMKDHLDDTRATQRCQLQEIDAAFGQDYSNLLTDHANKMDKMLAEWSSTEDQILHELNELGERWVIDLNETDQHYYNECRRTRNSLTDDIQFIESELEKLKTSFTLNNEILDYNCRVLKLREEERASLITRQKRKINKLSDKFRLLKEHSGKATRSAHEEEKKLVREVEHLKNDCEGMERKFAIIKGANDRQLDSLCQLAEDRIGELLKKLAHIDERIFVEILEQPWDGLVGISHHLEPESPELGSKDLDEAMDRLEKNLKYMFVDTMPNVGSTKERLMKALDLTDEQEFRALLTSILTVPDKDVMKELACFLHQQRSRPADQPASSRRYLVDAASIRAHFSLFKETAVPKTRMDMWKLLSRALIKYERILRDRLTLAADILTLTK